MYVCARRHGGEEKRGERKRKSVTHGINEDVRYEERKGVPGENQRADRLSEQCEARPCAAEDIVPSCEVEEVDGRRMEVDVEALLDALEYVALVNVVVACVDDACGFGPALLCRADGGPEDAFATASCVTIFHKHIRNHPMYLRKAHAYQNGWKKPTMPLQSLSAFPPLMTLPTIEASTSSQSSSSFPFLLLCSASYVRCSFATLASSNSLRVRDARRKLDPSSSPANRRLLGRRTNERVITANNESMIRNKAMVGERRAGRVSLEKQREVGELMFDKVTAGGGMVRQGTRQLGKCGPSFCGKVRSSQRQENLQHHEFHLTMFSSRLLRPPACRLVARSTPTQSHISSRRAFHATRPRNDAVLDAILYLPHEMMSQLHTTLPWYATIPLTAFIIRGFLVTTAGSWARALTARYIGLHPLRQAMAHQKMHELMKEGGYDNPRQAKKAISTAIKQETSALDKRWNCTLRGQMSWTLAQIPIFFAMAEIIRQMCATRDGLLGMVLTKVGLKTEAGSLHGVSLAPENPWFEPTLANEGMLWFTDLLVPDPTGALPFVVSALMFTNVYITKNGPTDPDNMPATTRNIRRLLLGVSLLVGPLCQELPAALMLYWASSTSSVIGWNWWLDRKYPAPKDALACKRPLKIIPAPKGRRV